MANKLKHELKKQVLRATIVVAGLTAGKSAEAHTPNNEMAPNVTEYAQDMSQAPESNTYQTEAADYRQPEYGTPEWAAANGWKRDARLSRGLNRVGKRDGTHGGWLGAYYNINNPEQIMFLPNDPIHDKPETCHRNLALSMQRQNNNMYGDGGYKHNPNKVEDANTGPGRVIRDVEDVVDAGRTLINIFTRKRGR